MKNILITTSSFANEAPALLEDLRKRGLNPILNPLGHALQESDLATLLDQYRPVGMLAGTEPITRSILERSGQYLKVISRVGAGWDNVDRETAASLHVRVYRTEGVLTQSVAELAMGHMLNALRKITTHDRLNRAKKWVKSMGTLLHGKTVGIIGFGKVGRRVGQLVKAFGASVIYHDPMVEKAEAESGARACSLDDLLHQSDIISLHASGDSVILGEDEFQQCKHGVILINTARGGLIDEEALIHCLKEGQVGFAGLDVFNNEPYTGPLCDLENVAMTPHIGSYAHEARIEMESKAVFNLLKGLKECGLL
jgi:D-3-phosphoglycerate dehydrogenase